MGTTIGTCNHCGGTLRKTPEGDFQCWECSREVAPELPGDVGKAVVITVELRPTTLQQLYGALASAQGLDASALLMKSGLSKGKAKAMANGSVIYPEGAAYIIFTYGITPSDWTTLMLKDRDLTPQAAVAKTRRASSKAAA